MKVAYAYLMRALIFEKPDRQGKKKGFRQTWNTQLLAEYLEQQCADEGPFYAQRVQRMLGRLKADRVVYYDGDWWVRRQEAYDLAEKMLGVCPDDTVWREIHAKLQPTVFELMGIDPEGKYGRK